MPPEVLVRLTAGVAALVLVKAHQGDVAVGEEGDRAGAGVDGSRVGHGDDAAGIPGAVVAGDDDAAAAGGHGRAEGNVLHRGEGEGHRRR